MLSAKKNEAIKKVDPLLANILLPVEYQTLVPVLFYNVFVCEGIIGEERNDSKDRVHVHVSEWNAIRKR